MNTKEIVIDNAIEPCEACGATAEIGFVIREDDKVASIHISASNKTELLAELENYTQLAKSVNEKVAYESPDLSDDATELEMELIFECSAEKLIFELKSRTLAK